MKNRQLIRNSTAEFLIFTSQDGKNSIEARFEDETIWLSQKMMSALFEVDVRTINEHLKNIYKQNELIAEATIRIFRIVQTEGKREVIRNIDFYSLDAIISVGYRVNSVRATQFRQWATMILKEFAINRKKKEALINNMPDALHKLAECKNESHYRNIAFGSAQVTEDNSTQEKSKVVVERSRNQNGGNDE